METYSGVTMCETCDSAGATFDWFAYKWACQACYLGRRYASCEHVATREVTNNAGFTFAWCDPCSTLAGA